MFTYKDHHHHHRRRHHCRRLLRPPTLRPCLYIDATSFDKIVLQGVSNKASVFPKNRSKIFVIIVKLI